MASKQRAPAACSSGQFARQPGIRHRETQLQQGHLADRERPIGRVRPTHGGAGYEFLVTAAVPYVERLGQFSDGRSVQQLKAPGTRVKRPCEDRDKARQQVLQIRCLGFRVVQSEEYLGLGLAHLIIGLIQRQARDQYQLLPWRRETARERPIEQRVEFAQNLADLARRQVQPGQAAALIRHLLQELVERAQAAGGSRRDPKEGANLRGIVRTLPQQGAELPVQPIGERPDGV